ncbi:MAG TPA: RHS repeat-associated core domain-containing protein, partial [Longimicrobiaceae bacterium]
AVVRAGDVHPQDGGPAVQFHLEDHLGSSVLVADASGGWVNREELSPFGQTTFGSFARKRYRFTGRERDGESGLTYHGLRYYLPWTCRWASPDPAGMVDGPNLYAYCRGNPVNGVDPTGTDDKTPDGGGSGGAAASGSGSTAPWLAPIPAADPGVTPLKSALDRLGGALIGDPLVQFKGGSEMNTTMSMSGRTELGPFYYASKTDVTVPQLRLQWRQSTEGYRVDTTRGLGVKLGPVSFEGGFRTTDVNGRYAPVENQRVGYYQLGVGNFTARYYNDHNFAWFPQGGGTDQGDTAGVSLQLKLGSGAATGPGTFRMTDVGLNLKMATGIPNQQITDTSGGHTYYPRVEFNEISTGILSLSTTLTNAHGVSLNLEAGVDSGHISNLFQNQLVHRNLGIPEFPKPSYVSPYVSVGVSLPASAMPGWLR